MQRPEQSVESAIKGKSLRTLGVRCGVGLLALMLLPLVAYRITSNQRLLVRSDAKETTELQLATAEEAAPTDSDRHAGNKVSTGELRLAVWNIAHGRGSGDSNWEQGGEPKRERIKKIAKVISEFNADVVVLNEVDFSSTWSGGTDQADAIAKIAGYPFGIKQANLDFGFLWGRWYFGNVILSRFPISDPVIVPLTPLNRWEPWLVGNKRGVSCSVHLPDGQTISLVGLHLESRGEAIRVRQVDDVARHCGTLGHRLVVAGDLNTTPGHFPHAQFNSFGVNAFDRLISQTQFSYDQRDPGSPNAMTFSCRDPKIAIDWVLVGSKLTLSDVQVVPCHLSDHRPLVAKIILD
jgi:endonuclease/exonuclease/phosphatase family metal-dependent hydrolase